MKSNKFESNIYFWGSIKAGSCPPGCRQLSFSTFHVCMRKVFAFASNEARVKRKRPLSRPVPVPGSVWVRSQEVESTAGSSLNTSNFYLSPVLC